ncbi:PREDICTED: uncharacterized protein LOC105108416 isoform X4 [Populus euphratica]|uniref:Uncharacterized protein LOC105108416 isoform X4 n=1 Tax=Populus euphratica TaxID=75702 RepID=A0AAJ6X0B0_POPEU|nr:PREDICTED: uncharacterized protein LOC105108416 isoform X4 [Populus euphratica]
MNRPIIWICRRWTPWLMRWMNSLELYLSVVNLGGSHVSVMMKKSGILVVEDGTLAAFPVTFEEHKEELQSDIKAEEPWSPTFQLAKGKIILDVGCAVPTQLFCRILESQHRQAGQALLFLIV